MTMHIAAAQYFICVNHTIARPDERAMTFLNTLRNELSKLKHISKIKPDGHITTVITGKEDEFGQQTGENDDGAISLILCSFYRDMWEQAAVGESKYLIPRDAGTNKRKY